jgi:hypothetical protein
MDQLGPDVSITSSERPGPISQALTILGFLLGYLIAQAPPGTSFYAANLFLLPLRGDVTAYSPADRF